MTDAAQAAGPLKKITLTYTAGTGPDARDLAPTSRDLEFIFGIAVEGFTLLECALDGKIPGDSGVLEIAKNDLPEFFGHILDWADVFPVNLDPVYFHYTITSVADVPASEVVRAMAKATAEGGCGGGGGCGCGGH